MIRIAFASLLLLALTLFGSPAFCQEVGSYQDYLLPGFDHGEFAGAPQTANQYNPNSMQQQVQPQFNQQTQPQFNQIVSPTQVPQDYQSAGQFDPQQNYGTPKVSERKSAYEQQEMALQQSEMAQQLEDAKNQQQAEESFRMSSEFNDKSLNDPNTATKKNKAKGVASSMGRMVKGGLRYATPLGGAVASVYLMRAAFGNSMMAMPMMGGGMMIVP